MTPLTLIFALAFLFVLALLIRSLFRQAGIQDAIKQTTDQASSQLKLWEEFGEHLDIGVALVNEHDDIEYCNQAFANLVGWTGRSAFHQPLANILVFEGDQAKLGDRKTRRTVKSKEDGTTPVYAARRALHKPAGYAVVTLQDASAEEAERSLRKRLVNLSSFELRAPITAIKGFADMLQEGDAGRLPEAARGYAKRILESTNKLLGIIDDMGNMEELSTTKRRVQKQPVEILPFLQSIREQLTETATAAQRELELAPTKLDATVEIDREAITRLLTMLTNTAARNAKTGTTVAVRLEETPQTIEIRLENDGEPIPRESQDNIFDYVGAQGFEEGIGFHVAKQIIEAHRAAVNVTQRPGGNVFVLSLPKLAGRAHSAKSPTSSAAQTAARELAAAGLNDSKGKPGGKPKKPIAGDIRKK